MFIKILTAIGFNEASSNASAINISKILYLSDKMVTTLSGSRNIFLRSNFSSVNKTNTIKFSLKFHAWKNM